MRGRVRSRPLRVAFLMTESEHAHLILDGIFANCYSRWGGRFSPIVLCDSDQIPEPYWPWLEVYDPDIVYSYVSLSRDAILEIHERLCPSEFKLHRVDERNPRLDVLSFKPSFEFKPLSSLSTIFRQARYPRFGEPRGPVRIIDAWPGHAASRMLTDNFGLYRLSYATGMYPADARQAGELLTIAEPETRTQHRAMVPRDRPLAESELAVLADFASHKTQSVSLASMLFAPKIEIRFGEWSSNFNLVIGEAVQDRILFWNARLLIPGWLDVELCCFRVTMEELRDPAFAIALGDLLKHRNHVNSGSGGQHCTMIRSISHREDELEEARQIIRGVGTWGVERTACIANVHALVPTGPALAEAHEPLRFGLGYTSQADWLGFEWEGNVARPPVTEPDHLVDVPPNQVFGEGYWASDFEFGLPSAGIRLGEFNYWRLPKRWRLAGAFGVKRAETLQHQVPPEQRRSRLGALCIFSQRLESIMKITVPTPEEALRYAFEKKEAWAKDDVARGHVTPASKVSAAFPSSEARYLKGVLGMTSGLDAATGLLLQPFLKDLFAQFGGTPSLPIDKLSPTVNDLRKRAKHQPTFNLMDEQERTVLATMLLKASRWLRKPKDWVALGDLKSEWAAYRQRYWTVHPDPNGDTSVDWDAHEGQSLNDALSYMRDREMMFQGHHWGCPNGHHRNWVNFDALTAAPSCAVCKTLTTLPVDLAWMFRPNTFLIDSLRDHSVLSLIWVLSTIVMNARSSFAYVGPTGFSFDPAHDSLDAEADLLVLCDGQAMLCEVKSSWSHLRASDIAKLVSLSKRLRPDVALLAVMDNNTTLRTEQDAAKTELEAVGIKFQVMQFDANADQDEPYLRW